MFLWILLHCNAWFSKRVVFTTAIEAVCLGWVWVEFLESFFPWLPMPLPSSWKSLTSRFLKFQWIPCEPGTNVARKPEIDGCHGQGFIPFWWRTIIRSSIWRRWRSFRLGDWPWLDDMNMKTKWIWGLKMDRSGDIWWFGWKVPSKMCLKHLKTLVARDFGSSELNGNLLVNGMTHLWCRLGVIAMGISMGRTSISLT